MKPPHVKLTGNARVADVDVVVQKSRSGRRRAHAGRQPFPGTNCRGVSREERERVINRFALEGANIVRVARDPTASTRLAVTSRLPGTNPTATALPRFGDFTSKWILRIGHCQLAIFTNSFVAESSIPSKLTPRPQWKQTPNVEHIDRVAGPLYNRMHESPCVFVVHRYRDLLAHQTLTSGFQRKGHAARDRCRRCLYSARRMVCCG